KIIVLFDEASATDLQKLLASKIDACIPLFASPRTLIGTLQLIVGEDDLRVVILNDAIAPPVSISSQVDVGELQDREAPVVPSSAPPLTSVRGALAQEPTGPVARRMVLSKREEQILKALVGGQSNKMIARVCSVTEATVKVHMKSILRKIRVTN